MKTIITLLLTLSTLLACVAAPLSPEEHNALQQLNWIETNSPEEAAAQALATGDKRLLGFARRGAVPPGIDKERSPLFQKRCGVRVLPGTGDIIYGDQQLKRLKEARQYAKRYNRFIAERCLSSDD